MVLSWSDSQKQSYLTNLACQGHKKAVLDRLFQYNCFESEHYFVTFDYLNEKEYKELLKEYKAVVSLYLPFTGIISFISNRVSYKMLSDIELNLLYNKTLKELYIPECPLIF